MHEQLSEYKKILEDPESMACLEAWEILYLHEKAIRDCYFLMHDEEPPQDEYGHLTPIPQRMLMRFWGEKFHALLEASGHTATDFQSCTCHKHYTRKGGALPPLYGGAYNRSRGYILDE